MSSVAEHACARSTRDTIKCWGLDSAGETAVPIRIDKVHYVSTGIYTTCVLVHDRYSLECWGLLQVQYKSNATLIMQVVLGHS